MYIGVSLPVREMGNDLTAIRDFAQAAEGLGLTHLRIPDQIMRPGSGHLHEPMMLLSYLAAITSTIELVPSVIILPVRQTVHFAKQAAELDTLSGGRVRLGIGVGASKEEYQYLNMDFNNRGKRCDEQMVLLKKLWTQEEIDFQGDFHTVSGARLNPLPNQKPIPMWIGARSIPSKPVVRRIAQHSDGWFVLCSPEEIGEVRDAVFQEAEKAGRKPDEFGQEAGVAVVGPRESEWKSRVSNWSNMGLTHLCLRTLGGDLAIPEHLTTLTRVMNELPVDAR
jgi:probable F420-dependent oxidoreductase